MYDVCWTNCDVNGDVSDVTHWLTSLLPCTDVVYDNMYDVGWLETVTWMTSRKGTQTWSTFHAFMTSQCIVIAPALLIM